MTSSVPFAGEPPPARDSLKGIRPEEPPGPANSEIVKLSICLESWNKLKDKLVSMDLGKVWLAMRQVKG